MVLIHALVLIAIIATLASLSLCMSCDRPLKYIGFIFIIAIGVYTVLSIPAIEQYNEAKKSIEACQQDLPRSKTCVLKAVPE